MNELPNEILEFILAYLPPYDDFLNCRLVCKRWNQAIQSNLHIYTDNNFSGSIGIQITICPQIDL